MNKLTRTKSDHSEHTVETDCPSCGVVTTHHQLLAGQPGKGMIYRCVRCDLRRLLPLPDPVKESKAGFGMYEKQVKQFNPHYAQQVNRAVDGYLQRFRALGHQVNNMLDLGGGMGYYSRAFAEKGVEVTYLDRDPVSIRFAKPLNDKAGIRTLDEPIESFSEREDNQHRFDLVFFRHVIEHCPHPDEMLRYARKVCAPDGLIVIETDNNRSLQHLLHPGAGPFWHSVYRDMYRQRSLMKLCSLRPLAINKDMTHYYAFRKENLKALVERTGWRVLDIFDYSLGDPTFWPNIDPPCSLGFWKVRRKIDLSRAVLYTITNPLMRAARMGAGLAVFATPAKAVGTLPEDRNAPTTESVISRELKAA